MVVTGVPISYCTGITLATARTTIEAALQAPQNAFTTDSWARIRADTAISAIFEKFLRLSQIRQTTDTAVTVASTATVSLSAVSGYARERVSDLRYTDDSNIFVLSERDRDWIRAANNYSAATSLPLFFSYETHDSIRLSPVPDDAYTITLTMSQPLISWTFGTTSATTLNIPQEYAIELIYRLAAPVVGQNDPTRLIASPAWTAAEAWCRGFRHSSAVRMKSISE
jgi:hypothetical protein